MSALERSLAESGSAGGIAEGAALPAAAGRWQLAAAAGLFAVGLWCLRFQLQGLWFLWTGDALRSIGMLVPPVSLALALRAWSWRDWRGGGSWWGLVLVVLALGLAVVDMRLSSDAAMFRLGDHFATFHLIPVSVLICVYASGVVVLLGGVPAWRKAAFPLLLLLAANPVPSSFSTLVDLPLQRVAALCARAFAAFLGVQVSPGTLQMMFAPRLGMFIAPGCDGLRGATTMGLLALVAGHLYRLPRLRWIGYVAAAVGLAYLFNLLRLCGVVIYFWLALRFPSIGASGTEVDYAIGGTLFFLAAAFLLRMPGRLARKPQ
jgi:exosortase J